MLFQSCSSLYNDKKEAEEIRQAIIMEEERAQFSVS